MIVLVTGGRNFNDFLFVGAALQQLESDVSIIVHGDARGADSLADQWALENGVQPVRCPANWDFFQKAAGPVRNRAMLILKPALVVAFPGGSGTADMVSRAKKANIPVWEPSILTYEAFKASLNPLESFSS